MQSNELQFVYYTIQICFISITICSFIFRVKQVNFPTISSEYPCWMAVDYSLVVTWTYFTVYVTIFFAVSIYCAIVVKQEYDQHKNEQQLQQEVQDQWSKKKLFKKWYRSVWKKKKVYLNLIPHLFDQATDFGVIAEYWRLRNNPDEVGINTIWLFGVSIFVILFYRIASTWEIYRLTQNEKFAVLQFFDLLMIQSVWTNYELDTDEPSNSQRYLQVLEAMFEVK